MAVLIEQFGLNPPTDSVDIGDVADVGSAGTELEVEGAIGTEAIFRQSPVSEISGAGWGASMNAGDVRMTERACPASLVPSAGTAYEISLNRTQGSVFSIALSASDGSSNAVRLDFLVSDIIRAVLVIGGATYSTQTSSGTVGAESAHIVIAVPDPVDRAMIYLNGSLAAVSNSTVAPVEPDQISIGSRGSATPGSSFQGSIHEVRVWDGVPSADEVESWYRRSRLRLEGTIRSPFCSPEHNTIRTPVKGGS